MAIANNHADKLSASLHENPTAPEWVIHEELSKRLGGMYIGYRVSDPQFIRKQWASDSKPQPVFRYTTSLTSLNERDNCWRETHSFDWFCGTGVREVSARDILESLISDVRMLDYMPASEVFGQNEFGYPPEQMARIVREITENKQKLVECLGYENLRALMKYFEEDEEAEQ